MIKKTFLIEVGTEEIPAKILEHLSCMWEKNFIDQLNLYQISYKKINVFSTPRRLALKVIDIDVSEKTIKINKKGPSVISAFDKNGLPTEATMKWIKHCGININEVTRVKTKKGEWLSFQKKQKQEKIQILLPKIIEQTLKKISIKKTMRWNLTNKKFSRPIRNIVMLLGDELIKGKIFNISSNKFLQNHLCSKEKKILIKHPDEYPEILFKENNIISNHDTRKETIIKEIKQAAKKIHGFIKINHSLTKEVASLVESPVALLGKFKKKFILIPEKILVHTIEKQQKCFPVYDINQKIIPYFIFISNINSPKPKKIILGNEKVMNARLSDTEFFLKNDKKIKLEQYLPLLKNILFQDNLGSLYEKTLRIKYLMKWMLNYTQINIHDAIRSAILSKCDLVTDMACEFPELQGTIGMYYALQDQETKDVSIALKEQYLPSFSGDTLPLTKIGSLLSIIDKIDTLSGMFILGKTPKSDHDPFGLRRLSIGIIRIIINSNLSINLEKIIKKSLSLYHKQNIDNQLIYSTIIEFFKKRLFYWYIENGYDIQIIKSVLSCMFKCLIDTDAKIKAISFFKTLDYSKSIILSIKRISNILEKNNKKITGKFNVNLIQTKEEEKLFITIEKINKKTKDLFIEKKYKEILLSTKTLETPIKNLFENVKIHDSDNKIELNRLVLLKKIENFFSKITNFYFLY